MVRDEIDLQNVLKMNNVAKEVVVEENEKVEEGVEGNEDEED